MTGQSKNSASFRDLAGFVFTRNGEVYRQVNRRFGDTYSRGVESGLYAELQGAGLLIEHEELPSNAGFDGDAALVLKPRRVEFISYPYEWGFFQLRDAAIATLKAHKVSLRFGFGLRDATPFNVQFVGGIPKIIDTLSFGLFDGKVPWIPYQQFCREFLAPLLLMSYRDARLGGMLQTNLGGIPLDLTARLLPWRAKIRPSILGHIVLQSMARQNKAQGRPGLYSPNRHLAIVENLEVVTKRLRPRYPASAWVKYHNRSFYPAAAQDAKLQLVAQFLQKHRPAVVWDLGANTGMYSELAARHGARVISWDSDPAVVDVAYQNAQKKNIAQWLPLRMDLFQPSPRLGWAHSERAALLERGPADLVLALALVHHIIIKGGVPFPKIVEFFAAAGKSVLVEHIPPEDPAVIAMQPHNSEAHPVPSRDVFVEQLRTHFDITDEQAIPGTKRTLFFGRRESTG